MSRNKNSFGKIALISTIGLILTRFISMIYVIPFAAMLSSSAVSLNSIAYGAFTPFYELSLAGLPFAIAQLVSKYNARNEYETSDRVLKYSLRTLFTLGLSLSVVFIAFSGFYANYQATSTNKDIYDELVRALYFIAPALAMLPILSGIRGYLQGFQTMIGVSISQVVERLVFVVVTLLLLYIGIYYLAYSPDISISYAFIALPIATFVAILSIMPFYRKMRREHRGLVQSKDNKAEQAYTTKELMKQIILTAIPFVIAGFAATLYSVVTTSTFQQARIWSGTLHGIPDIINVAEQEFNIVTLYTDKLVSIPLTFSMALSTSIISFVTSSFERQNMKETRGYTKKAYRMILFATIVSVVMMGLLGEPLAAFFFGQSKNPALIGHYLKIDGFRGVCFALEVIVIALLQGLGKKNKALIYSCIGPVVKLIINVPLVYFFGLYGEIGATILGLMIVVILSSREILRTVEMKPVFIWNIVIKTIMTILPMLIFTIMSNWLVSMIWPTMFNSKLTSLLYLGVVGIIGLLLVIWTGNKLNVTKLVFGQNIQIGEIIKGFKAKIADK